MRHFKRPAGAGGRYPLKVPEMEIAPGEPRTLFCHCIGVGKGIQPRQNFTSPKPATLPAGPYICGAIFIWIKSK